MTPGATVPGPEAHPGPAAEVRAGSAPLWTALPASLGRLLRPEMRPLAGQILDVIQQQIPEYARPQDKAYLHSIRRGVEEALNQFVDRIVEPDAPHQRSEKVHRALGRNELGEGRSLDSLQRAYRLGARLAWRRLMTIGARAKVPQPTLLLLGEAIITHIDELAALAVEGYADAQAGAADALGQRRRRLLELLLTEPPAAPRTIEEAAHAARWPLPSRIVVVALDQAPETTGDGLLTRRHALVELDEDPRAVLPVGGDEVASVDWARALPGARVAISPPVPLAEGPHALRSARRVLTLVRQGTLPDRPVTHVEEHLPALLLRTDEPLLHELAVRELEPLANLTGKQRARLAETLQSWLQTRGGAPEMAGRLQVHPQTVRYRMRRLEELFGDRLHDPDARFRLAVALRSLDLLPTE